MFNYVQNLQEAVCVFCKFCVLCCLVLFTFIFNTFVTSESMYIVMMIEKKNRRCLIVRCTICYIVRCTICYIVRCTIDVLYISVTLNSIISFSSVSTKMLKLAILSQVAPIREIFRRFVR